MENKHKLFSMVSRGIATAMKEGFLPAAAGVVLCIFLDTWNQLPFLWNGRADVNYYWFNSFSFGGFYSVYIIPMLSCIPYAASFCEEYRSNMITVLVSKINIKTYCISKVITTAVSGGLSLAAGGIFFIFLASRFTDLINERTLIESQGLPYYALMKSGNGISFFIVAVFLLFLSGVLWSSIALLVSSYVCNRYIIFVTPFISSFFLTRLNVILNVPAIFRLDLLLHARSSFGTDMETIFITTLMILVLVIASGFLFCKRAKRLIKNEQFI